MYRMNGKLWGDDIINSLICIFISTGQEMFLEKLRNSKCHNFLLFQPIFIRFPVICSTIFTLSSEIKLNLVWISSLSRYSIYAARAHNTLRPFYEVSVRSTKRILFLFRNEESRKMGGYLLLSTHYIICLCRC